MKLSIDGVFLAVTQLTGAVKLIKMPPVLNPLEPEREVPATGENPGTRQDPAKPAT